MKAKYILALSVLLLLSKTEIAFADEEVLDACSKQSILKTRDDIPRIKTIVQCTEVSRVSVSKLDSLGKIQNSNFDPTQVKNMNFCFSILNSKERTKEIYLNGQLSYNDANKKFKTLDVNVSGFPSRGTALYAAVHRYNDGKVSKMKQNILIDQEQDRMNVISRYNVKTGKMSLDIRDIQNNYLLHVEGNCFTNRASL